MVARDFYNNVARKVPHVTAIFWLVKILTTAFGESLTDYLVKVIDPVVAVGFGALGLVVVLGFQLLSRKYTPIVYWLAVVMVAVFGTMAADVTHIVLHVPYVFSTIFFFCVLAVIFILWYSLEKTLSIHSIYTSRRELFYWATVLATFALGTAAGDFTAITLHLGFLASGLLFCFVIAVPALGYLGFGANEVAMFWFAYIVTRPLGASFADWFGKPMYVGGLGLGDGLVSLVLGVIIFVLVAYLQLMHADAELGRITR